MKKFFQTRAQSGILDKTYAKKTLTQKSYWGGGDFSLNPWGRGIVALTHDPYQEIVAVTSVLPVSRHTV